MANELSIRIDSVDIENAQSDGLTATIRADATLCGYSIPWNEGGGRYVSKPIEICEVQGLELRITVADDYSGSTLVCYTPSSYYPFDDVTIPDADVRKEIDDFALQFTVDCRASYQE